MVMERRAEVGGSEVCDAWRKGLWAVGGEKRVISVRLRQWNCQQDDVRDRGGGVMR